MAQQTDSSAQKDSMDHVLKKDAALSSLPLEWKQDLMDTIRENLAALGAKLVILDDDPTGTQTVHGLPILTGWDVPTLEQELAEPFPAFFILTNSRAMVRHSACNLAREIGANLKQASEKSGVKVIVVSRSDSTLRGHFPHEVDEAAAAMAAEDLPYLICPFFLEGGRFTLEDIHYVAEKDQLIPAARTAYARDKSFGFSHSNLKEWVEEKTGGNIKAQSVVSVGIDDIRSGGPEQVFRILSRVPLNGACIVNAASYRDLEVVVTGLLMAMKTNCHFLYRTAASFVRVLAGVTPQPELLSSQELVASGHGPGERSAGGLMVVGSYVPKTTSQVNTLLGRSGQEHRRIQPIEIDVSRILEDDKRDIIIKDTVEEINDTLKSGIDALVYTSRSLVAGHDAESSLRIGQRVSACLIKIVKGIRCQPKFLLSKGGITSSDIATEALGVKRAMVLGQVLPGVPVWELGDESLFPGMPYIIFPGNVGDENALDVVLNQINQES
ncbi:MAG: hypothetical protein D3926_02925 [Desulfobacteraceae bacterium]|nr:MAG: hypothetical protein D3926_02925 [Desulfobacteraceae bacterium]